MRYFRLIGFCFVLFLLFTASITAQEANQEKSEEELSILNLIRKDLLNLDIKKLDPPKRNIFTPNSSGFQETNAFRDLNESQLTGLPEIETLEAELPLVLASGLKYIGYVKAGQKITALILFEGEALAVDVGEEIAEGVSISKITPEDITVIGPDQEPRKVPLEGVTP